ncbi:MAG: AsmA family protein [Gammaproteobacteria bacterium]
MRVGRWVIGIVAGLVLLALLTVLAVTMFVDPNRFRGQIERAVTDASGQPFKIEGDLHIAWYPWLALQTGPAQFGKPGGPDATPIVQWQSARVGAKLIPLTQGQLVIDHVRLDGPRFHLRRGADGRANWDEVLQGFRKKRKPPEPGPDNVPGPQIAGFEIREGTLDFADDRSGLRFTLEHWLLDVGEWKAGATFPVETQLVFRHGGEPGDVKAAPVEKGQAAAKRAKAAPVRPLVVNLRLTGRLHVSDDANDFDIFGLDSHSLVQGGPFPQKAIPIDLQVSRLAARLSPLDVAISEVSGRFANVRLSAAIQAGETGTEQALYARGPITLEVPSVRALLATLEMAPPLPLDKGTLGQMKLTSKWDWNDGAVTVNDIDLLLDETRFNGEFARARGEDPTWTFALHGDKIGLSRYAAIEDKSQEPFELPVAALRALKMQGELTFEQAWLADAQMKNVRLRVEMADGVVSQARP